MLSSVLKNETTIEVNIRIMRAFMAVRQYLTSTKCSSRGIFFILRFLSIGMFDIPSIVDNER